MLPDGLAAAIDTGAWTIPPLFEVLRRHRQHSGRRLPAHVQSGRRHDSGGPARAARDARKPCWRKLGETPFRIGEVIARKRGRPRVEYR